MKKRILAITLLTSTLLYQTALLSMNQAQHQLPASCTGIVTSKYAQHPYINQIDVNIGGLTPIIIRCTINPNSDIPFNQILEGDQVKITVYSLNPNLGIITSATTSSLKQAIAMTRKTKAKK